MDKEYTEQILTSEGWDHRAIRAALYDVYEHLPYLQERTENERGETFSEWAQSESVTARWEDADLGEYLTGAREITGPFSLGAMGWDSEEDYRHDVDRLGRELYYTDLLHSTWRLFSAT